MKLIVKIILVPIALITMIFIGAFVYGMYLGATGQTEKLTKLSNEPKKESVEMSQTAEEIDHKTIVATTNHEEQVAPKEKRVKNPLKEIRLKISKDTLSKTIVETMIKEGLFEKNLSGLKLSPQLRLQFSNPCRG